MNLPLSIILPIYNHADLLPMALEGALSQSFGDFELIIVNDGSTDHTLDVIHTFMKQDKRIKLINHSHNQGIANGVSSGMQVACGHYIHVLSATDCYLPGFLERSMSMLLKFPQIGLCCTDLGLFVDDPTNFTVHRLIENAPYPLVFTPPHIERIFKYARFDIPGFSAIIKKSSFISYGGYRGDLGSITDMILNQRIALFEGAVYIPESLVVYREPGYSKAMSQNPQVRNEVLDHLSCLLLQPENREFLRRMQRAATLGILYKGKAAKMLKSSQLRWGYIPLIQRALHTHWCRLLHKPYASEEFLLKHSSYIPAKNL